MMNRIMIIEQGITNNEVFSTSEFDIQCSLLDIPLTTTPVRAEQIFLMHNQRIYITNFYPLRIFCASSLSTSVMYLIPLISAAS
jgi:hypothetical protein